MIGGVSSCDGRERFYERHYEPYLAKLARAPTPGATASSSDA